MDCLIGTETGSRVSVKFMAVILVATLVFLVLAHISRDLWILACGITGVTWTWTYLTCTILRQAKSTVLLLSLCYIGVTVTSVIQVLSSSVFRVAPTLVAVNVSLFIGLLWRLIGATDRTLLFDLLIVGTLPAITVVFVQQR